MYGRLLDMTQHASTKTHHTDQTNCQTFSATILCYMYQCKGPVDNNEYNSSRDGIQIVHAHTSMHICVCVKNYFFVCLYCMCVCVLHIVRKLCFIHALLSTVPTYFLYSLLCNLLELSLAARDCCFVPDLLYSIKRAFDQNVISTYDLYSGFTTGYGPRLVPYSRALFKLISVTCEMAESMRLAAVVPLNGKNYPTWKIQCRMALMKEGLWSIVSEEETEPQSGRTEIAKFRSRRDKALATIVLSVDIALLYLIGITQNTLPLYGKNWLTNLRRKHGQHDWISAENYTQ